MLLESQKMATNIQFEKWTADQVAEWLRGLDMDDAMIAYMHYFLSSGVDGKKLLMMTHADLEKLNVLKLGHQELILEAIDLLRNLRYGYETENMQLLALQLGCKARSLNGEMRARSGKNDRSRANVSHIGELQTKRLSICILLTVADLLVTLKSLVSWMDKAPFSGLHDLCLVRNTIVKLGLDLIFMCQGEASLRDVDNNITTLTNTLSEICEKLVIGSQDSPLDPLYLQPASLEQATIRKKQGEELGMHIQSIYYGVHVISEVKDMSPADLCGKIERGDEVIQVNHQIVAGWSLKKLVNLLKENPKEIVLLLKKRPRHISPYGHMINKKKQAMMNKHVVQSSTLPKSLKKMRSRDGETMQLRPMQEFVNSVSSIEKTEDIDSPKETLDGNDTDNDVFRSGSESPQFTQYSLSIQSDPKQRRATVSGGSPTLSRPLLVIEDIDVPVRPKSFMIASTRSNMPREIIINSPSGDNLSEFLKKTSELKMKSSPPSQELSVPTNSTPQIIKSNDKLASKSDNLVKGSENHLDINNAGSVTSEKALITNTDESNTVTLQSDVVDQSQNTFLDNSTNSVESTESSMESQQSALSHDNSSHSLNMEEKSNHSEKESSDFVLAQPAVHAPYNVEACIHQRTTPTRVVQHYEVASDFDKNQPQLMKITKIDSLMRNRKQDVDKKNKHVDFQDVDSDKEASKDEQCYVCMVVGGVLQKIPVEPKGSQVQISSPVQRRNKPVRKKVDRRVSCKDLGKGDCEGWLFKRKARPAIVSSNWQKRWCVIKDCNLFCYHDKEALKAKLVINLPVFKVSPVEESEVKTKKYPFKVHNNGASFMFASERKEDMTKWMNKMGLAAITCEYVHHNKRDPNRSRGTPDPDFSESETEEEVPEEPAGGQSRDASPDINSSQVDLPQLYRKQSKRGRSIFGEDLHAKRKSTLRGTTEPMSPETIRLRKLTTLQRTLKAKCKEIEEIDRMLSSNSRHRMSELKQYLKGVDSHSTSK